jgi:ribosomal-protein-alanine N-acetyltransferase
MLSKPGGFKITIRKALKHDLGEILRIHEESPRELGKEDPKWFKALLESNSKRILFLIALIGDKALGYSLAYRSRGRGYIENIAIDESHRGQGIGSMLLEETEKILLNRGVREIYLCVKDWNKSALNFYLKHNYKIKGTILWFTAPPERVKTNDPEIDYTVIDVNAGLLKPRLKYYASYWSSFVDEVDRYIYKKKLYRAERAILVRRGRRAIACAIYSDGDELIVDSISLSSYNAIEALEALLNSLKNIAIARDSKIIEIPVDSSKQKLIELLVESRFKMNESEFLLHKELIED